MHDINVRQRRPVGSETEEKSFVEKIKQLDAFPRVPEKYTKPSRIGGTLSILSRALIIYVIYIEVNYYLESRLVFKFVPDMDMDTKLKINIDLTVATPCMSIGADILDTTGQNMFSFGRIEEQDTWWEMDEGQKTYFEYMRHLNTYLREQFHSIASVIFKDVVTRIDKVHSYSLPERQDKPREPYDACRILGELSLNKVAGNFHITAGKSIHLPRGHIHLTSIFDFGGQNFSHRINRFSFGRQTGGIVHPLEGDEVIVNTSAVSINYYIDVVQTDIYSFLSHQKTFQYSVKENTRPIDHDKGSHGNPGIYFKYDVSALKVVITEDRENVAAFLIRLCSVIAGIVVICGFVNTLVQAVFDRLFAMLLPQYKQAAAATTMDQGDAKLRVGVQASAAAGVAAATAKASLPSTNLLFQPAVLLNAKESLTGQYVRLQ